MEEIVSPYVMPVIVVVVYCVCYVVNKTAGSSIAKYVPLIAAILGVACSVVVSFAAGITTDNVVEIIAQGLVSGLAATGVWELYKNATKEVDGKHVS